MNRRPLIEQIRDLDSRLLLAGERLARYRTSGTPESVIVQRGVIDRLLDNRLDLMREHIRQAVNR